jgi:hypothetical protein
LVQAAVVVGWRDLVYGGPHRVKETSSGFHDVIGPSDGDAVHSWQRWPGRNPHRNADGSWGPDPWSDLVLDPATTSRKVRTLLGAAGVSADWTVDVDPISLPHRSAPVRALRDRLGMRPTFKAWMAPAPLADRTTRGVYLPMGLSAEGKLFRAYEVERTARTATEARDVPYAVTLLAILLDHDALRLPSELTARAPYGEARRTRFFHWHDQTPSM